MIVLASILNLTTQLGYPLLGVAVGVEALGVPVPGETAVIFAGLAASSHRLSIVLVIVVASAGAIIGDNIGFVIGRRGGRALLSRPGRFYEERQKVLAIGDPFFARHGAKAVFLGRWIAGLRVWASWLAGAGEQLLAQARETHVEGIHRHFLSRFSGEELAALDALLERFRGESG